MTASEWRAARAFEDLAEMSLELSEARAVAAADRQEHATALAALKAHSERGTQAFGALRSLETADFSSKSGQKA